MKKLFITVNKVDYEVKFSFSSLKIFLEMYGETKFSAIDKYISKLVILDETEPSFEFFEVLGKVILSGVLNAAQQEVTLTESDVLDVLMLQPEKVMELITAFMEIVPKDTAKSLGKPKGKVTPKKK